MGVVRHAQSHSKQQVSYISRKCIDFLHAVRSTKTHLFDSVINMSVLRYI